jgi:hypothetical protein
MVVHSPPTAPPKPPPPSDTASESPFAPPAPSNAASEVFVEPIALAVPSFAAPPQPTTKSTAEPQLKTRPISRSWHDLAQRDPDSIIGVMKCNHRARGRAASARLTSRRI